MRKIALSYFILISALLVTGSEARAGIFHKKCHPKRTNRCVVVQQPCVAPTYCWAPPTVKTVNTGVYVYATPQTATTYAAPPTTSTGTANVVFINPPAGAKLFVVENEKPYTLIDISQFAIPEVDPSGTVTSLTLPVKSLSANTKYRYHLEMQFPQGNAVGRRDGWVFFSAGEINKVNVDEHFYTIGGTPPASDLAQVPGSVAAVPHQISSGVLPAPVEMPITAAVSGTAPSAGINSPPSVPTPAPTPAPTAPEVFAPVVPAVPVPPAPTTPPAPPEIPETPK